MLLNMGMKERLPQPEEITELANVLDRVFLHRHDLYAKQLDDGSYVCIRRPLTQQHLEAHLRGELTLGAYALDEESMGKWMVLDADDEPDWRRLRALSKVLANEGAESYLERSRRGGHLWFFFNDPIPAAEIRQFGHGLMSHFGIQSIELFPKQDRLKTGPGSLVRLPFGVHRKSSRRYSFSGTDDEPLAPALREQICTLERREMVPNRLFSLFRDIGSELTSRKRIEPAGLPAAPMSAGEAWTLAEQIKSSITVKQFVSEFVELSPQDTGLCPFHNDTRPSFSVNNLENYWHCFGCGAGGSIIDFYMRLAKVEFPSAVNALSERINLATK